MKKILFASTALVAAGLLGSSAASADDKINLQLGGFSKWWVVGVWNSSDYLAGSSAGGNARSYNNVDIKGDNEVWFGGSTKLDNGLKIGVDIHLEAGGHTDMTTDTIDKSYVYVEGGFGKFIVGANKNGTYLLHVTAPDAAGNWNEGGEMTGGYAVARPANVMQMAGGNTTAINTTNNADGITYVAPTFYGLTVGASYIPNAYEDSRGPTNLNATTNTASGSCSSTFTSGATACAYNAAIESVYGVGALYANTFSGVGVKVSAGAVTARVGNTPDPATPAGDPVKTASQWFESAFGSQLSYDKFTLGGSYRNQRANYQSGATLDANYTLGNNATTQAGSLGNGQAFDVGLQYADGPYAVSFAYFHSAVRHCQLSGVCATMPSAAQTGNDITEYYQVSGKYNLGPGIDVLSSAGYANYNSAIPVTGSGDNNHNSGWTVMSGMALTF
jgi:outer membrane protein OmpU